MRLLLAMIVLAALAAVSLLIGVGDIRGAMSGDADAIQLLLISRLPRTLALILAGASLAIAGLLMQMMTRNRFVEPSTAGTAESAALGILVVMVFAPDLPVYAHMLVAAAFALAGTMLFLAILGRLPARSSLIVPLVGLMLGGVIDSVTTFFAYRLDLLQSLAAWTAGDFSAVLQGRYELLWIASVLAISGWATADRFTLVGLGDAFTTNLGLNYRRMMVAGLLLVAMITATIVATVGIIPFLGLVAPNIVSMVMGDNLRRAIPWTAATGSGLILLCDIVGRTIRFPYEIPVSTVIGVGGAAAFFFLLFRRKPRHA